jgi:glycosyltransferase involved in cell wall biosynthesis
VTPRLNAGGVERLTIDVARAVAAAGARSLVASHGGRLEPVLASGGGELIRLPVHSKNPLVIAANAVRLARIIRRERVSLVHVRSRAPAFSALMAARATGVPLVATYHGIYGAKSAFKRWYNAVMTRGDLVIANSAFTRDHVLAQHPAVAGKLVVIPEGVDTDLFDPAAVSADRLAAVRAAWGLAPDDGRRVLLLAARLTGWKGQDGIVGAMRRMKGREGVVLILAGRIESLGYALQIQTAAAAAGLSDQVRLVGAVDDMPAAYGLADLVLAPSPSPESFGRSVAEAGAMGRPVLASRLGGPAETVIDGQTGWLAPPGDVEAWTRALDAALSVTPQTLAVMGRAARARIEASYSLKAMCAATFAAYGRLVERRT